MSNNHDEVALEIARRFIPVEETQRLAQLQVAIIKALQQVGAVQEVKLPPLPIASTHNRDTGDPLFSSEKMREFALAARQPGAQEPFGHAMIDGMGRVVGVKTGMLIYARPQPAELAEQQAIADFLKERDEALGCPDATDAERAESARLIFALAATGKQQVGEVQGDAHALIEEFVQCASVGRPPNKLIAQAKDFLAARQPGAQEELHGFLKNSTPLREAALRALGFIDRSDAHGRTAYDCLRRELHAECAAPPAQQVGEVQGDARVNSRLVRQLSAMMALATEGDTYILHEAIAAIAARQPVEFERAVPTHRRESAVKLLLELGFVWNNQRWEDRRQPGVREPVSVPEAPTSCKHCDSTELQWFAHVRILNDVQQGRLNTHDVGCVFVLGCEECSETLRVVKADDIAALLNAAPPAQGIDQWKPIETAPTDGTRLMLWDAVSGRPVFGSWRIGSAHDQGPMTHWAPEPSMPMNIDQRDAAPGVKP